MKFLRHLQNLNILAVCPVQLCMRKTEYPVEIRFPTVSSCVRENIQLLHENSVYPFTNPTCKGIPYPVPAQHFQPRDPLLKAE